jgi:DNA-binding NtrC family response regulator
VKPVRGPQLELVVNQALEMTRLQRENQSLREEVQHLRSERRLIGDSIVMTRLLEQIRMVAPTRATVLVQGESGTGKELVARTIHELSDRADKPFISINCAALPESLIESTLFGHERGAFTGALKQVKGAFERAHKGTLLLDEISEMRLDLQAKLLRVLQEQEFDRVGGTDVVRVDVRVIATTNRNLQEEARAGRFREDLFYRLTVVPIAVPPLREHLDDIATLAHHFARRAAEEARKEISGIAPEAIEKLQRYNWPGNVRELSHAVERAVILSRSGMLEAASFDLDVSSVGAASTGTAAANGILTLTSYDIGEAERLLIERALTATNQNRTRAAELLGISIRTLRNKLNSPDA